MADLLLKGCYFSIAPAGLLLQSLLVICCIKRQDAVTLTLILFAAANSDENAKFYRLSADTGSIADMSGLPTDNNQRNGFIIGSRNIRD